MRPMVLLTTLLLACTFLLAAQERTKSRSSSKTGWIGVGIQDVTPRFAREQELKIKEGAYVNEVVDDSPADSAGIREEDIIVEFNGKKVETSEDLTDAVRETKPGTKAAMKVNRNGETKNITVTVGRNRMRMPFAMAAPIAPKVVVNMFGSGIEGMELMDLNKQLAEYFEVSGGKGVLVTETDKDENAAKAGIKAGDVITKIGDEPIRDIEDLNDAVSDAEEGEKLPVELLRKGKKVTVSLEISEERDRGDHIFWRNSMPGNFNFHVQPHMEQLQEEMQMRMKELPRKQRELQRIEKRMSGKEV